MRENKATVTEGSLKGAFAQGVNEAFRLTGYCMVVMTIGGRIIHRFTAVAMSEIPELVRNFMDGLRGNHYEAGIQISILPGEGGQIKASASETVEDAELGDGIEDAEIIES